MGGQHTATLTWGFVLNHSQVLLISSAMEKKLQLEGKEPMYPSEEEKEINYEYLEDIFSGLPTTKYSVSFDIDDVIIGRENFGVVISYKDGIGSAERWGGDCELF
jgi:hypothetical protein